MPQTYDEAALLFALEHARGWDREVLLRALGRSSGVDGVVALRRFAAADSGEKGTARAAAIQALGKRVGAEDTERYASALRDQSSYVQLAAIAVLAQVGDARAGSDVFDWFRRKVRRATRSRSWDPTELPSVLRYADRNDLLGEFAPILHQHLPLLESEERAWLRRVWPIVESYDDNTRSGEIPAPDRVQLSQPLFEEHRFDADPAELEEIWNSLFREAFERVQRGAARQCQ